MTAQCEGAAAAASGKPLDANPYALNDAGYWHWAESWFDTMAEADELRREMPFWEEGVNAYNAGKTHSGNPYLIDTAAYMSWFQGWLTASMAGV